MFGALRLVSVEQGFDPRDFALVGFGGAGPLHANALGILTQAWPTIIPPGPGVLCAYGDATTVVRDEASKTFVKLLKNASAVELATVLDELKHKASTTLITDGIALSDQEVTYQADVRYTGQAFQLSIEFTLAELQAQGLEVLKTQFDKQHTQLFTFALEEGHEIVMVRAIATASSDELPTMPQGNAANTLDECKLADSQIYFEGHYHPTPIYDRNKMQTDLQIPGPAIVSEMDSTTVILPGYHAMVDTVGNLLINPAK